MSEKYISLNGAREFKGRIISHPKLQSLHDLVKSFNKIYAKDPDSFSMTFPVQNEELDNSASNNNLAGIFEITRIRIRSKFQLWNPQPPGEYKGPKPLDYFYDSKKMDFFYPVYLGCFSPKHIDTKHEHEGRLNLDEDLKLRRYFIIAVPFASLFKYIDENLKFEGEKVLYYKFIIADILRDLFNKKDNFPEFRITMFQGKSASDPLIGNCLMTLRRPTKGDEDEDNEPMIGNLVDTDLFKYFYKEENAQPTHLRLKFDDVELVHRLSIESDAYGNYSFYIRKEGANFCYVYYIFQHFVNNGWFEATTQNPGLRMEN